MLVVSTSCYGVGPAVIEVEAAFVRVEPAVVGVGNVVVVCPAVVRFYLLMLLR